MKKIGKSEFEQLVIKALYEESLKDEAVRKHIAEAIAKRKEEEKRKEGYKITNLTGEDFFDCTIYYYPSRYAGTIPTIQTCGCYVDAEDIGDFKWKASLTVRKWDGAWRLSGTNAYGDHVMTRIITGTIFTERDLID